MQIRPDANTSLRIGGNEGEPSALSGIADAEIDVTSRTLGIEVVSQTNTIFAESNQSEALIKTNKSEVKALAVFYDRLTRASILHFSCVLKG